MNERSVLIKQLQSRGQHEDIGYFRETIPLLLKLTGTSLIDKLIWQLLSW